jgi:hypothetical protein
VRPAFLEKRFLRLCPNLGEAGPERPRNKRGNWCDPERRSPLCKRVPSKTWTVSAGPGAGNPGRGSSFRSLSEDRPPSRTGACGRTKLDGPFTTREFKVPDQIEWKTRPGSASQSATLFGALSKPVFMSNPQTGPHAWGQPYSGGIDDSSQFLAGNILARSWIATTQWHWGRQLHQGLLPIRCTTKRSDPRV